MSEALGTVARDRPGSVVAALGVLAAVAAIALWRARPPPPRGPDAPAGEFSAARALAVLDRILVDDAPHPVGTAAHASVRERLLAELRNLGFEPRVEESLGATWTSVSVVRNVVARLEGSEGDKAVLVCAHYDSVGAGPGAGDDGSGVAMSLEIARALRAGPAPRSPIVFLFTDAEEAGLVGADAYARAHRVADEIAIAVNLEARGTEGRSYLFETSSGNADLVRLYARAVPRPCATSAAYEVYKRLPNDTDFTVFKEHGVPGLNFSFIGGLRRYHTPLDDRAHLSAASVQHQGDQALAVVRALASEPYLPFAEDDAVYADVLGTFLVRWPASATATAALVVLAAVLVAAALVRRRETGSALQTLRGALLCCAVTAASCASALAVVHGLGALRQPDDFWAGNPLPSLLAIGAGAVAACALLARLPFLRRAGPSGAFGGAWILCAVAGAFVAWAAAGASYLFLLPCSVAVLASALSSRLARCVLPAGALVVFWVPLSVGLYEAVELGVPVAIGLPIGGMLAAAVPALIALDPRTLARVAKGAASVCALACAWALAAPAQTVDRPAWLSLQHVQQGDGGARLFAATFGRPLPREIAAVAPFSERAERPVGSVRALPSGYVAAVASTGAEAPEIVRVGDSHVGGARVVRVHVASKRSAPLLVLQATVRTGAEREFDAGVASVAWRDHRIQDPPSFGSQRASAAQDGRIRVQTTGILAGAGSEGFDLELRAPADGDIELLLLDVSPGLPEEAGAFARARPLHHVPRGTGDVTVVSRRVSL